MNDFEANLKSLRLASPSAELDRRIAGAFATSRRPSSSPMAAFWWSFTAATAIGAGAFLLALRAPRPAARPEPPLIYRFEAEGQLRQLLLDPPAGQEIAAPIFFRISTS